MPENRCVQLATIQRNAAGAVLVADAKARHLDASPVDLLRIVKARCRRRAPLAVRGCPIGAPHVGVLEYHRAPYVPMSTPRHAYLPAGSIASCSSVHATVEYSSTVEYPRVRLSTCEYAGGLLSVL
jgi:hypothetical protein